MKRKIALLIACLIVFSSSAFVRAANVEGFKTKQSFSLNKKEAKLRAYSAGGKNYVKLADLANILKDTKGRFNLGYDGVKKQVVIKSKENTSGKVPFKELDSKKLKFNKNSIKINFDGKQVSVEVIEKDGKRYFELKGILNLLKVPFNYDKSTKSINITSEAEKDPVKPKAKSKTQEENAKEVYEEITTETSGGIDDPNSPDYIPPCCR